MKSGFCSFVVLCLCAVLFVGCDSQAMVVERGRCGIVVAEDAVDATRFAAMELQSLLETVLGEEPSVVNAPLESGVSIILGENRWSKEAGLDASALPRDGFIVRVEPERIFICGRDDDKERLSRLVEEDNCGKNGQHATLFGVYAFLERCANCRFFFPGEMGTILPRQERLKIPLGEVSKSPYFTSRSYYKQGDGAWYEPRCRKALNWLRLRMETYNPPCCHGQNKFMALERFAKTHPEYFQLRKDGTRCTNVIKGVHFDYYLMKQLCHTSGVWDEFYKDAVSYLRGEDARVRGIPSAAVKGTFGWNGNCYDRKYIDMMPQDGMFACECPSCRAAYLKDERQYARELIWGNTARFAKRLKADGFKDAVVTQMAYGAYRGVPDVDVPDNVLVIVAQNGPWSCTDPAKLDEEIGVFKAWSEKTGRRIRTWTYPHKYGALRIGDVPCMAPRAWGTYFKKAAPYIIGGFCESESDRTIYQYLNYYVYSKIAWNPNTDVDALIADHHRAMFGKGAAAMARFYDGMEEMWTRRIAGNITESAVGPVACVPDEYTIWADVYSEKVLKDWADCFDEALSAVAGDEASARRIRFIRMQFLEPLEKRAKVFRESVSVARGLALREKEPNRSILVNGELDTLEGWSGRPGGKMELDGRVKCRGSHSVKLVSTDQFALCQQDLAGRLKPDTDYRVSFFMKLEDVTPVGTKGTRGACLELADGGWKFFPPTAAWCGTKDWTFHEYTVRTGKQLPPNPQLLAVLFSAKGTAWFDDIRLEECPPKGNLPKGDARK